MPEKISSIGKLLLRPMVLLCSIVQANNSSSSPNEVLC